ncbi:hypothetical protein, conserved [Leishmania tarentolae]|uniref:Uncharacterized protein n=1 Tax=Leishmania tarentolae TaxID=5689 RepID=A0A640KMQ2_LEITA|nr:hypothetical protein, conserved [Leishmania tarentolae]
MLHEVYTPRTVADVAWSRQKTVALSTAIQQARARSTSLSSVAPHIVLLYGPPGCGKLETLKVLLREDATLVHTPVHTAYKTSCASQGATAQLTQYHNTSFHIFHTCETTVSSYAQYLHSVLSYCRGQLGGGELPLPSLTESPESYTSSGDRKRSVDSRADPIGGGAPSTGLPTNHAHIIKFYGEPASHALHRCTLLFLREYEELRAIAQHQEQDQAQLLWPDNHAGTRERLVQHLRRNLIFFLHTTHDTHNDKLDLNTSFPATLLQSSAVELFHCTPITEINLRKRLRSVLDSEAQRHAQKLERAASTTAVDNCEDSLSSSPSTAPLSAVPTSTRRTTKAKRRVPMITSATANAYTASSSTDLMDPETLNAVVAGSQGDIRQALLQVHWLCLIPASSSLAPAVHQSGEPAEGTWAQATQAAAKIWMRLEKQRLAVRQTASAATAETGNLGALSVRDTTDVGMSAYASHSTPSGAVHCEGNDEDGEIDSERESDALEEVSSKNSGETMNTLSSGFTSSPAPQTSRKRQRHLSPPAMNMLSLLDFQCECTQAMPNVDDRRRRGIKRRPGHVAYRGAEPRAAAAQSHQRSVLPMTRDEYLGLSHAIGRLLTQKYCIDEVLSTLNVPPRKVLGYLTNNQIRYFGNDQLPQYARCIDAASDADALRASELSGDFIGAPNVASLRERRQLADRTTAGENLGSTGRLLESIALYLFHHTYRAVQTEVRPPPGFVAQEPPPYLRLAYPRLRDISHGATSYLMRRVEGRAEEDPVASLSEREWVQQALLRLKSVPAGSASISPASCGTDNNQRRRFDTGTGGHASAHALLTPRIQTDEVDILREGLPDLLYRCGSTEAVLLDYYALAPYIVLTVNPPLLSQACNEASTTAQSSGLHVAPNGPSLPPSSADTSTTPVTAPRRTVFRFASASLSASAPGVAEPSAHAVHTRPCLRPCTPLQLAILQRGRNPSTAQLRSDLFVLSTDGVDDRVTGAAMERAVERPLIPHGDEIEDIDED